MAVPAAPVAAIVPGALDDAAIAAYSKAFDARRDTTSGLGSMLDQLKQSQLFDVVMDGAIIARYALKPVQRANGVEMYVVAAAGAAKGVSLVHSVLPFIEQSQCQGADCLTVNTRRRGLVKQLAGMGWKLDSYVMRKKL